METALLVSLIILTIVLAGAGWLSKGINININYNMPEQPAMVPMEDILYDKDGKPIQSETEKALNDLTMRVQNIMLGREEIDE
jgi:hypothetical protein